MLSGFVQLPLLMVRHVRPSAKMAEGKIKYYHIIRHTLNTTESFPNLRKQEVKVI